MAVLAGVSAVVVAFAVESSLLFVWPGTARPSPAGMVVMLNGPDDDQRRGLAFSLVEKGMAPVLLYSQGNDPYRCPRTLPVRVVCFEPRPSRTVGELAFAIEYARSHGIDSMLVVAGHAQVTRARLMAQRCFNGRVEVVAAATHWWEIPAQVLYEWGATAKALVLDRSCSG